MTRSARLTAILGIVLLPLAACDDMSDQPKYETMEDAPDFDHDQAARVPPEGTVARDELERQAAIAEPPKVTRALLDRGRDRFDIYCSPCHGLTGDGRGMIVQRGFPAPPDYYSRRLRSVSDRHIFDVISRGYGVMFPYGNRIDVRDRWAIVAYVRALQRTRPEPDTASVRTPGEGGG